MTSEERVKELIADLTDQLELACQEIVALQHRVKALEERYDEKR